MRRGVGDIERISGNQRMNRRQRLIFGVPRQHIVAVAMMSLAPVEWQEGRLGRIGREILVARNREQDVIFGVEMKGRQRSRRGDEDEGLERPPRAGLGPGHALDRSEEHPSELQSLMRTSYAD